MTVVINQREANVCGNDPVGADICGNNELEGGKCQWQ